MRIWLPPAVRITDWVWLPPVTGLPVSGLGTVPAMMGRSGSFFEAAGRTQRLSCRIAGTGIATPTFNRPAANSIARVWTLPYRLAVHIRRHRMLRSVNYHGEMDKLGRLI